MTGQVRVASRNKKQTKNHQPNIEKSVFFQSETEATGAEFPSDVIIRQRPISLEMANIVIPFPTDRMVKSQKTVRQRKPRAKPASDTSAKSLATRKSTRSSATKRVRKPKTTAAARQIVVPEPPPPALAHQPAPPAQAARVAPLPRAAAVTLHRKIGLLDIVGFWLRQKRASAAAFLARPVIRKPVSKKVKQLAQENAALRAEIARLQRLQQA